MPVSFLDLVPAPPSEVVTIDTRDGPQDIELVGIPLRDLAAISRRFPAFARVLDGGVGSIIDNPDALGALVAAALGHPADKDYEAHVARFPSADVMRIAFAVIRLTFPQRQADPLPPGDGSDAEPEQSSQPTSSN